MAARDDILAVWEGNNDFLDATGNGYGLVNSGAIFSPDAKLGSHSILTDGVDDKLTQPSLDLRTSERSFASWIKPTSIGGSIKFIHQHRASEAASIGSILIMNIDGTVRLLIGDGSFFVDMTSISALSTSVYKRVAFRSKAGSHQLIIGNAIEATSLNVNAIAYSGDFQLAGSTVASRRLAAKIDGTWLWSKWKSDADFTEHFNDGVGIEFEDGVVAAGRRRRMLLRGN